MVSPAKTYLSPSNFFKWFKAQFGLSPLNYINHERIKTCQTAAFAKAKNIKHVSMCGFADVNYFVRTFKRIEGITPGMYQSCMK